MIPSINTRTYTNLILTAIAAILITTAVQQHRLPIINQAHAQREVGNISRTATGVPIDNTIPQTQDVAVAAATSEIAAANREIAEAIRLLAQSITDGASDIRSVIGRQPATSTNTAPAPAASTNTPSNTARPVVEVQ